MNNIEQQYPSSNSKSYETPNKIFYDKQQEITTQQFTPDSNQKIDLLKIDYKAKTFKLMKQIAELEVKNKKCQTQIRHYNKELDQYNAQTKRVFESINENVKTFDEAIKSIKKMHETITHPQTQNQLQVQQWTKIIEEYKKIINAQQFKYIKLEQQCKIAEIKVKKYEEARILVGDENMIQKNQERQRQTIKKIQPQRKSSIKTQMIRIDSNQHNDKIINLQKQLQSYEQQLKILKQQYKKAILQKNQIKDLHQILQLKYNDGIVHLQQMQKNIEEKLEEVQKEMTYYQQQREQNVQKIQYLIQQKQQYCQKIQLLKKQLEFRQNKQYFSFHGVHHQEIQTQFQIQQYYELQKSSNQLQNSRNNQQYSDICMEVSIKTLLEQNQRLKNALYSLYTRKEGQQLAKDVQLQLKILVSMKENYQKNTNEEKYNKKYENKEEQFKIHKKSQYLDVIKEEEVQEKDKFQVKLEYQEESYQKKNSFFQENVPLKKNTSTMDHGSIIKDDVKYSAINNTVAMNTSSTSLINTSSTSLINNTINFNNQKILLQSTQYNDKKQQNVREQIKLKQSQLKKQEKINDLEIDLMQKEESLDTNDYCHPQ